MNLVSSRDPVKRKQKYRNDTKFSDSSLYTAQTADPDQTAPRGFRSSLFEILSTYVLKDNILGKTTLFENKSDYTKCLGLKNIKYRKYMALVSHNSHEHVSVTVGP